MIADKEISTVGATRVVELQSQLVWLEQAGGVGTGHYQSGDPAIDLANASIVRLHRLGDHPHAGGWRGVIGQIRQPDIEISSDEREYVIDVMRSWGGTARQPVPVGGTTTATGSSRVLCVGDYVAVIGSPAPRVRIRASQRSADPVSCSFMQLVSTKPLGILECLEVDGYVPVVRANKLVLLIQARRDDFVKVAVASTLDIGEFENMRAAVSAVTGLGDSIALAGSAEMIQAVSTMLA